MTTRRRAGPPSVLATVDSTRRPGVSGVPARTIGGRLVAVWPASCAMVVDLGGGRTILGRAPDDGTSPALPHATVSRRHVQVEWDARLERHVCMDLGSRNGATLDGRALSERAQILDEQSVLRVGDVVFVYESGRTLEEPDVPAVSQDAVPGEAMAARRLRRQVARAAPDISPALIIGETGTGKEQVARELHRASGRAGELVAVNCATLGAQLIESQLFGHKKGAFTGAAQDQEGLFVAASGGTLFLDEIAELPLELQPKLLRAIQEREVRALGSTRSERVDVRIVAATHADLARHAQSGRFRQDLYARLTLFQLAVAPLRARRVDVLSWFERLHRAWCDARHKSYVALSFDAEAAEALVRAPWPENLRGVDRLVHELAMGEAGATIRRQALPAWVLA